jgi:ATP-binding cassette subfamily B protein
MKTEYKIKQHDEQDCGVACIASIAAYYGLKIPLIDIRDACGSARDGTTLKGIAEGFGRIGIDAKPYKSPDREVELLGQAGLPVILHTVKPDGTMHFVALYRINGSKATVMDPGLGNFVKMPLKNLRAIWSGYLVTATPRTDFKKGDMTRSTISRLASLILTNRRDLGLALAGALAYIILGVSTSLFLQEIIDKVLPSGNMALLRLLAGSMILMALLSLYIGYGRLMYLLRTSIRIDSDLVMNYINHLFKLPVSFFAMRKSGELNSRINDAFKIRAFISESLMNVIISIFTLAASLVLMFTYYRKLALMVLAFVPAYAVLYTFTDKVNRKIHRKMIESAASFQARSVESIACIREIKHFSGEDFHSGRIGSQYAHLAGTIFSGGKAMGGFGTASEALTRAMTLLIMITGSTFILEGNLTTGELVSFYSLAAFFSSPLAQLVGIDSQMNEARISADRLFEIMDAEPEAEGEIRGFDFDGAESIEINSVSFSFPGRKILLKDFSLSIPAGTVTAVTGESGCGKSTLAALIMRDYKPDSGSITVSGIDISLLDITEWRRFVTIVPQNSGIMSGTLLECITCNEREPDVRKVIEICEGLGLHDFIAGLPSGLLSPVGENGCSLSGGQVQRVALARALYRRPKVLILDEATSSLDRESESIILNRIMDFAKEGGTVLMITHKIENTKIAGKTIILGVHPEGDFYTPETVVKS